MDYRELFLNKDDIVMAHTKLAEMIGLEESIAVNKIWYWVDYYRNREDHTFDGKIWVYNSYEHWKSDNFPFWSISKIKRLFTKLEKDGIIISGAFNKKDWDRTKWYTVNFTRLQDMLDSGVILNSTNGSEWNDRTCQDDTTNTTEYTQNTSQSTLLEGVENDTMNPNKTETAYDENIVEREINKSLSTVGIKEQPMRDEMMNVVLYYYEAYRNKFGIEHPRISQKNMDKVIEKLRSGTDLVADADLEQYMQMIDKHLNTVYPDCNYSIMHFISDGIMDNKFYETCY